MGNWSGEISCETVASLKLLLGALSGFLTNYFVIFNNVETSTLFYLVVLIMILGSLYNLERLLLKKDVKKRYNLIKNPLSFFVTSYLISLISTLVSVGSSLLISLILLNLSDLREKAVVRLSLIFGTISTFFGSLLYLSKNFVNFELFSILFISSIPGSLIGQHLHHKKIPEEMLREIISFIILIGTILIIFKSIWM